MVAITIDEMAKKMAEMSGTEYSVMVKKLKEMIDKATNGMKVGEERVLMDDPDIFSKYMICKISDEVFRIIVYKTA